MERLEPQKLIDKALRSLEAPLREILKKLPSERLTDPESQAHVDTLREIFGDRVRIKIPTKKAEIKSIEPDLVESDDDKQDDDLGVNQNEKPEKNENDEAIEDGDQTEPDEDEIEEKLYLKKLEDGPSQDELIEEPDGGEDKDDEDEEETILSNEVIHKPRIKRPFTIFNPKDDLDYLILELKTSITRYGITDVGMALTIEEELQRANSLIKIMCARQPQSVQIEINKIILMITAILEICNAIKIGGEKNRAFSQGLYNLKTIFNEYGVILKIKEENEAKAGLTDDDVENEIEDEDCTELISEDMLFRGETESDIIRTLSTKNYSLNSDTYKDVSLMRFLQSLIFGKSIVAYIEAIIQKQQEKNENTNGLRMIYCGLLKSMSLASQAKNTRKTNEILHSQPAEVGSFLSILENKKFPKDLWRQQQEGLRAVGRALRSGCRHMFIEMPAGTGKTKIINLIVKYLNPNGNSLVLEPSKSMCYQEKSNLKTLVPKNEIGMIADNNATFDKKYTIGTFHSVQRYVKSNLFTHDKYGLIVLDEAHRSLSDQRQLIKSYFPDAVIVGVTASATDISGNDVSDTLQRVYHISLADGIKAGIVNPMRLHRIPNSTDEEATQKIILETYLQYCNKEQAMIMRGNMTKANDIANFFIKNSIETRSMHWKMDKQTLTTIEGNFRCKKIPVLSVCKMLTEGWDHPELRHLILEDELTKEWEIIQRIGRVGRLCEGKGDSYIYELRKKKNTPMDNIFKLEPNFKDGDRIVEPEEGFWPKNAFEI